MLLVYTDKYILNINFVSCEFIKLIFCFRHFVPLGFSTYRIMALDNEKKKQNKNKLTCIFVIQMTLIYLFKNIFIYLGPLVQCLLKIANMDILALFQRLLRRHSSVFLPTLFLTGFSHLFCWCSLKPSIEHTFKIFWHQGFHISPIEKLMPKQRTSLLLKINEISLRYIEFRF